MWAFSSRYAEPWHLRISASKLLACLAGQPHNVVRTEISFPAMIPFLAVRLVGREAKRKMLSNSLKPARRIGRAMAKPSRALQRTRPTAGFAALNQPAHIH